MKKKLLSTILALLITVLAKAQCQNFEWAKRIDAGRVSERVLTDPMGNVYTLGNNIDQNIFVNTESFITKHSAQGDSLWMAVIKSVNINTANNDYSVKAYDFALDNAGNVYIAGWFQQHVDFNPGAATNQLSSDTWASGFSNIYGRDAYIFKLDVQGNFVWAKKYGGPNGASVEEFWSLTIDNAGNIYAAGKNQINGLLFKINSGNGNIIWQKNTEGAEPHITSDSNNHLYLTGYFEGTKDFDPSAAVYNLTSSGLKDTYVMKLDSAGNFVWANKLGGSGHDAGKSLTTDLSGNVFVTGYYTGTAAYQSGGTTASLPAGTGNGNNRNGFIAKMNTSDGDFMWVSWFRDASSTSGLIHEEGCGIALDQSENVYVTGHYTRPGLTSDGQAIASNSTIDIILFKLDNTTGNFTWITSIGGGAADSGKDIAVDTDDNILVTGLYNDQLTAVGYPPSIPTQDSIDFDPSPQSAYYLIDKGGLTNRFLLKLKNKKTSVVSHTICEGITFDFNGNLLADAGIYSDTLITASGCDSIVTLTLTVSPVTTDSLFITLGEGDVYDFNENPIDTSGVYTDTLTNMNGCDSLVVLTVLMESTTGISGVAANHEFKMYPNPGGGTVYFSETVNVQATDALGQIVANHKNVNSLNLSNQAAGVYFLIFTDNKGQVVQRSKMVKE
jgi:hypothetical protein